MTREEALSIIKQEIQSMVEESLRIALSVPKKDRHGALAALSAGVEGRLLSRGIDPGVAASMAKGVKFEVEVMADKN